MDLGRVLQALGDLVGAKAVAWRQARREVSDNADES
jgi:hypothetical protein